ncbi:TonB-dependent receptor [Pseudocolwellia sp. HL-MZ19]|uniref:TonB-dependent receptor n=1 Tax=Colwelliaceae TaxID=267889 RepID=UPI0009C060DC|nr:TonB-dependent receptor [Colwellia sp. PAMC 21821]ARD45994.1 TonB-dependent receptor [Colwellia sp. PAMC 21821]
MKKSINTKVLPLALAISSALFTQYGFAQENKSIEVIEVSGIRSSLIESMDLKKNASSIQDSIVAEDIGKFPDQNVAESLQRITGVMISRTNGEGAKVTVRGFGPKFNSVHLNNRVVATTDRGREFDFQSLPSELISGADVVKASRANIAEGSLGAYVNIRTARPLDKAGFQAAGSINAKYNDLAEEVDPKISAIVSNTFVDDTVGVLFGLSQLDVTNRIDSAGANRWAFFDAADTVFAPGPITDEAGNAVTSGSIWFPGRAWYSMDTESRKRTSANSTIQWAQNDDLTHTFDVLYSKLDREAFGNGIQVPTQRDGFTDVIVSQYGTALAATKAASPIDGRFQVEGQESEQIATGFNSKLFHDEWTFELDLSYSKAEATENRGAYIPHIVNASVDQSVLPGDPGYQANQEFGLILDEDYIRYDSRGGDVINVESTLDWSDPAAVRAHWNDVAQMEREDEIKSIKFDVNYQLDKGIFTSIDAGIAISERKKSQTAYRIADSCVNLALPEAEQVRTCNSSADLDDSIFAINSNNGFLSDVAGNFPRDFVLINDLNAFTDAIGQIRKESNWNETSVRPNETVSNTEDIAALYVQLNMEGEHSLFNWSGNVGFRQVKTKVSSVGNAIELLEVVSVLGGSEGGLIDATYTEPAFLTKENDYSNFLPSANVSLDFNNGYFLKAGAAKVMTRPAIEDIGVNRSYNYERATDAFQTGGNPTLEPYEATQFDLSLEYYAENGDAYSLAFFRKDIATYISTNTVQRNDQFIIDKLDANDNVIQVPLVETITEKNNRDGGTVNGIEIAGLHYFDYLPGFLSGFGIQANYTFTDSSDDNADTFTQDGVVAPGNGLEGLSENAYNIIAFYDKDAFQARIAYNWRESFLEFRQGPILGSNGIPQHVEDYGQFDFSTSYDINENFTINAEVINLTDESNLRYADVRERVVNLAYSGRRYQIGVSAKF